MIFYPAYYEWHLDDDNGKTIFWIEDPVDDIFHTHDSDGGELEEPIPYTLEELWGFVEDKIDESAEDSEELFDGSKFNIPDGMRNYIIGLVANVLYDYYCRDYYK